MWACGSSHCAIHTFIRLSWPSFHLLANTPPRIVITCTRFNVILSLVIFFAYCVCSPINLIKCTYESSVHGVQRNMKKNVCSLNKCVDMWMTFNAQIKCTAVIFCYPNKWKVKTPINYTQCVHVCVWLIHQANRLGS